jgi:hypothetical protein
MLQRFTALHRSEDFEILKFTQDWGVLGLCEHNLPASHSSIIFGAQFGFKPCSLVSSRVAGFDYSDDLASWRRFSAAADAVIQLAAKLNQDRLDDSEESWRPLLSHPPTPLDWRQGDYGLIPLTRPLTRSEMLRGARGLLAREIETWLEIGKVGLLFGQERGRWKIAFASKAFPNLFGLLSLKLMFHIAGAEGIVFCSTCPRAYIPEKRRPSANRANYCDNCKNDGTMWKEIKRRQRPPAGKIRKSAVRIETRKTRS